MSINGIGMRSALSVQNLVEMRRQLDDLQRQLGTGKKSDDYAGVGLDRGLGVGLRSRLASITGYQSAIGNVDVRLTLAQNSLSRLSDIGRSVKSAAMQSTRVESNGSTVAQATALSSLDEMLGLLNSQIGDRYLFSGLAADRPAVDSLDHIMNGDGGRAGFKQVVDERRQADLGSNGLGRLVLSAPTATSVQLAEDVAGSPFGFKLAGVNTTIAAASTAGPAGAPPALSIDFSGQPNPGDTVQFSVTLPDGSSETLTLTATTSSPPGRDQFTIGASPAATAANLQGSLGTSLGRLASTALTAASAVTAADNFFNGTPQRVAGPPFDTATALVAGTSSDTVNWYIGENGPGPARDTASARVDGSITVSYGLRANEEGIRWTIQNVAALAVMTFPPGDPNAVERNSELGSRVGVNLSVPAGVQKIESIVTDLASAQTTVKAAAERHQQSKSTLAGMLEEIEGVSSEQVAASIMALQVRLQASLQTTALLSHTSLVNFL